MRRISDDSTREVVVTRIPKAGHLSSGAGASIAASPVVHASAAAGSFHLSSPSSSSDLSSGWVHISPQTSPKQPLEHGHREQILALEPVSPTVSCSTSQHPAVSSFGTATLFSQPSPVQPSFACAQLASPATSSATVFGSAQFSPAAEAASTFISPMALYSSPPIVVTAASNASASASERLNTSVSMCDSIVVPSAVAARPFQAVASSDISHISEELFDAAVRACDEVVPALHQLWPDQDLQPLLESLRSSRDMISTEACRASCQRAAGVLREGRLWPSSDVHALAVMLSTL